MILFRDGLEVDGELLQREWRLPLRKLILAMPITAGIVALAAHWIVGLDWLESFLLGALLSPTDPVLSSSVVTNPRVPRLVRHSLNLESGLNDGLALPPVLALSAALAVGQNDFVWWRFILEDLTIGFAAGIAIGYGASVLLPRHGTLERGIPDHQKVLYAIGVALLTYGAARLRRARQPVHRRLRLRDHARACAGRTCAATSRPGRARSSRSSSSACSSCSARS